MPELVVCSVYNLRDRVAATSPTLVVSITNPDPHDIHSAQQQLKDYDGPVLSLSFNDASGRPLPGDVLPNSGTATALFDALDEHMPDGQGTLLVHCGAGSRRSPAMALMALTYLARKEEPTDELAKRLVDQVMAAAPKCEPNQRLLSMIEYEIDDAPLVVGEILDRVQKRDYPKEAPDAGKIGKKRKLKRRAFRP